MQKLVEHLTELPATRGMMLVTAESCTGGMVASAITARAGASRVFEGGFVTYSNRAKTQMLGVDPALLGAHGAVSAQIACAMAQGALEQCQADLAIAITGIAGPDGGSAEKPVGLVYIAHASRNSSATAVAHHFTGTRAAIQNAACDAALRAAIDYMETVK